MTLNLYILNSCILAGVGIGLCIYCTMIGFVCCPNWESMMLSMRFIIA